MSAPCERRFVFVTGRRVHLRCWGAGPAVLVLHGSPQSSRAVEAQALALAAAGLRAIAPDTPGNGLSDPLAKPEPDTGDFARALHEVVQALGLGRVGLYGFHTGAATATAYAALHPDQVAAVVYDGLPVWNYAERAGFDGYLPSFHPSWDGAHMAWLWARLEEQTLFFPWHTPTAAARMSYDAPGPAHVHANAMDLLDAGDAYRPAYAAALDFRPEYWIPQGRAAVLAVAAQSDIIAAHLDRPPASGLPQRRFARVEEMRAAAAAHLAAHPGDPAPVLPATGSDADGCTQGFAHGLRWRMRGEGAGRPLLLLHAAGDRLEALAGQVAEASRTGRPVLALELPGHGESLQAEDAYASAADLARTLADAADALGWSHGGEAVGAGAGGVAAEALATAGFARSAARRDAPELHPDAQDPRAMPSLAPEWDGAHLVRAFRIARWERLFRPWFRRDRDHALAAGDLAADAVHARAVSLLKAQEAWGAALRLAGGG